MQSIPRPEILHSPESHRFELHQHIKILMKVLIPPGLQTFQHLSLLTHTFLFTSSLMGMHKQLTQTLFALTSGMATKHMLQLLRIPSKYRPLVTKTSARLSNSLGPVSQINNVRLSEPLFSKTCPTPFCGFRKSKRRDSVPWICHV